MSTPRRILIVRLSAIGDTIHSLPLAAAIKKRFPDCFLGWIVEKPSSPLIVDNPLVDWKHVLPKGWLKSPAQVFELWRRLREARFDTAFDIQGLTKSAVATGLSGARVRVGFTRGESREVAPLLDNRLIKPSGSHAVDMTLSLMAGVGIADPGPAEFVLPACPAADRDCVDGMAADPRFASGYVLMGPWGSFPSKLWPLERFACLAEALYARTGLCSLMLGHGGEERGRVGRLGEGREKYLSVAPDVGILGVAELARRARLFVGCDSFPMHIAAAVSCPTLGLFGVTDPARLGPYGPTGRSVYERLTLPKSTRERRKLPPDNMEALSVEKVLDVCMEMALE